MQVITIKKLWALWTECRPIKDFSCGCNYALEVTNSDFYTYPEEYRHWHDTSPQKLACFVLSLFGKGCGSKCLQAWTRQKSNKWAAGGNGIGEELPSLWAWHAIFFSDPGGEQKPATSITGPEGAQRTRVLLSSHRLPWGSRSTGTGHLPETANHGALNFSQEQMWAECIAIFIDIFKLEKKTSSSNESCINSTVPPKSD